MLMNVVTEGEKNNEGTVNVVEEERGTDKEERGHLYTAKSRRD